MPLKGILNPWIGFGFSMALSGGGLWFGVFGLSSGEFTGLGCWGFSIYSI
jgi:hypothetical protein